MSKRWLIVWMLLTNLAQAATAPDPFKPDEHFNLLGHSTLPALAVKRDNAMSEWLQGRETLRLGTSAPDYPPFDLTSNGEEYEGLTADYAQILGLAMGLPVKVHRYENRAAALQGLWTGEIDVLGSANGFEAADNRVALSTAYAIDQSVLATRIDDSRSLDDGLDGLRISMVYDYLTANQVQALYPKATLITYPSFPSAINAVALGTTDVFLGDTLSTHYLLSKSLLGNVRMNRFGAHASQGFSFAVRHDQTALLRLVNAVLAATPASERTAIMNRWGAGGDIFLADRTLQLNAREQRWLSQHPKVTVLVSESYAPLTFYDHEGNFKGLTADLLELIRVRSGLKFDIIRAYNFEEMIDAVSTGKADMIAAIIPSNQRQDRLSFTRPYLLNSFVLVTRKDSESIGFETLRGKRLAIVPTNPLSEQLRRDYPDITLVKAANVLDSLDLLAQGRADGAVSTLISANYLLAMHRFDTRLKISATLGTEQARTTMATARDALELNSILNKALLSITPQELGMLTNRWRNNIPRDNGNWRSYRTLISRILLGASMLLILAIAWNSYLRKQIRQREQGERALSDQLEFINSMLNGTPHSIYVRDRAGRLCMCNDSYLQIFSVTREEVIGTTILEGVLTNRYEALEFHADYEKVMADGQPLLIDRPLQIGEERLTIYHWIFPYRDSLGEIQGIIGGWMDISERRKLLEDLRNAKERADDANRAKSTFLATMSHEIRTPMNAVIGLLELALKRADHGHLDRSAIEVAYGSANDLLELIGDILDIARIESGKLTLVPERANLRELVQSVTRVFDGLARQKSLHLLLHYDALVDSDVLVDPLRFKQIVSNVVSNAIKFTHKGSVKISVTASLGKDERHMHLLLKVQDSGIGITPLDQQKLFTPFAQAANQQHIEARSGAGLGLVICRNLCEMMGGHLSLQSQPGSGTEVIVSLDLKTLASTKAASVVLPKFNNAASVALNVLVIDDHPANRLLMCQQLGFLGHQYTATEEGAAGLKAWLNGCFDLVITDCNMPIMTGYALATAIRQYERSEHRSACVIFGFTANAQPEELQRCRDTGMDDCLFKPISLTALGERLAGLSPLPIRPEQLMRAFFSLDGLSALTGGNPQLAQRLIDELLASNQADLEELEACTRQCDRAGLANVAHKIKGAARIIQACELIERCEALERVCEKDTSTEAVQGCLQAIEEAMIHLEQALHKQSLLDN